MAELQRRVLLQFWGRSVGQQSITHRKRRTVSDVSFSLVLFFSAVLVSDLPRLARFLSSVFFFCLMRQPQAKNRRDQGQGRCGVGRWPSKLQSISQISDREESHKSDIEKTRRYMYSVLRPYQATEYKAEMLNKNKAAARGEDGR